MKPQIVARVSFRSHDQGGRRGPTPPDIFGCVFVIAGENLDCRLMLTGVGALSPGSDATVPIAFLDPERARQYLIVGKRFALREVREIADGEIVEVLI